MDAAVAVSAGSSVLNTAKFRYDFFAGVQALRRRPALVVLLYLVQLALALAVALPVMRILDHTVGPSGFGDELAMTFDLLVWANVLSEAKEALLAHAIHLLWIIPLYLCWKAMLSVGLLHALRDDQSGSFARGVQYYLGKSLLLGIMFLVVTLIALVSTLMAVNAIGAIIGTFWRGEIAQVWINVILWPLSLTVVLATLALMRDFARMKLVMGGQSLWSAFVAGVTVFFRSRQRTAVPVYGAWMVAALVFLFLPTALDAYATGATLTSILLLTGAQQASLLCRAAVTVGWYGSLAAIGERLNEE